MELNQKAPFVLQSGDSLGTQKRQGVSKTKIAVLSALGVLLILSVASICRCPSRSSSMQAGHVSGYTQPAGFDPAKVLLDTPSPEQLRKHLQYYTSGTHVAGINRTQAVYTRDYFKEQGIEAEIVEYYPWMNYPLDQRVALFNSSTDEVVFEAGLKEDVIPGDPATDDPNNLPAFHGYSADGNVTGQLVYANYGTREDFQALKDAGISIKDKIVLVRYGNVFRGLKVFGAELDGARGVLIYSDPADDGYVKGKVYPDGPWRPESSIQRGSTQRLSIYPGDPLTPGYAAIKNAPRLDPKDAENINHIPSLPISYRDAEPLLRAIQGYGKQAKTIGDNWVGGLTSKGVEYWTGPSELNVNLLNKVEYKITPIQNVIARTPGHEEPERAVIIGNHRDAWCAGASDPSSGSAALLELARSFGELLKLGWRPRRTIIFASWDAEEYGLVGSTEWVEENISWLRRHGVAYINVDIAVRGSAFYSNASPLFKELLYSTTKEVPYMDSGNSLYEHWIERSQGIHRKDNESDSGALLANLPNVNPLGSGSDYTAFNDFVGIPSLDLGFSGPGSVYHSNYDSFKYMETFVDPDFKRHRTLTQIISLLILRLSDNAVIPFDIQSYANNIKQYIDELEIDVKDILNDEVPSRIRISPVKNLRRAQAHLSDAADKYSLARARFFDTFGHDCSAIKGYRYWICRKLERRLNRRSMYFERKFIDQHGLPNRRWFKHVLVSPGLWKGYGAQTLPALTEAADSRDWKLYLKLEGRLSGIIYRAAASLR